MEKKEDTPKYKWPYIVTVLDLMLAPLLCIIGTNVLDKTEEIILICVVGAITVLSIVFLGIDMLKHHDSKSENPPVFKEPTKDNKNDII